MTNTAILLVNIGTPDKPTSQSVKKYLKQFLHDRRVIEIPRIIWCPILHGLILPLRSKKSAKLYKSIWTNEGSPLLVNTKKIAKKLSNYVNLPTAIAMNYGNPSIGESLNSLKETYNNIEKIVILPLYPQNSATTTASTFDRIANELKKWRNIPKILFINDYAENTAYINAICHDIKSAWEKHGKKFLVFSFHGIPKSYINKGDPYQSRCELTVKKISEELKINKNEYCISYQSRLGYTEWLNPYTEESIISLAKNGVTDIQVICPGFAADCLETLEEINIRYRKQFIDAGGEYFEYIPALNDKNHHIAALSSVLKHK